MGSHFRRLDGLAIGYVVLCELLRVGGDSSVSRPDIASVFYTLVGDWRVEFAGHTLCGADGHALPDVDVYIGRSQDG